MCAWARARVCVKCRWQWVFAPTLLVLNDSGQHGPCGHQCVAQPRFSAAVCPSPGGLPETGLVQCNALAWPGPLGPWALWGRVCSEVSPMLEFLSRMGPSRGIPDPRLRVACFVPGGACPRSWSCVQTWFIQHVPGVSPSVSPPVAACLPPEQWG